MPKQRKSKDANAPKRPMSAFLAFANSRRAELKRQMPEASNGELSRTLSIMWKEAPEELRQSYIKEEKVKRETYLVAMADWKRKAEEEKQAVRHVGQHEAQRIGESNLSASYCDGAPDITIPVFEHDNIEGNRYNRFGGSSSSLKMPSISLSRLSPYMLNKVSETYLQVGTGEHQQPIGSLFGRSITKKMILLDICCSHPYPFEDSNHVAGIGWQGFQNHSSGTSQYTASQISSCRRSQTRACKDESIEDLPPNQQHRSYDAPQEYVSNHATRDTWNLAQLTQNYSVEPTLSPNVLCRQAPQMHFNSSASHVPRLAMALSTQDVSSQVYDVPFSRASLARAYDSQQSHFARHSTLMAGHEGILLSKFKLRGFRSISWRIHLTLCHRTIGQSQLMTNATAEPYGSMNIVASSKGAVQTDRFGPHSQLSSAHGHGQYSNRYLAQTPTLNYMSADDGNEYFGEMATPAQVRAQLDAHGRQNQETAFWKGDSGF